MTEPQSPVLVIATTDPESRGILERELRVRYGSEYTVVVRANYEAAERLLVDLAQQEQPIAFIIAATTRWTATASTSSAGHGPSCLRPNAG